MLPRQDRPKPVRKPPLEVPQQQLVWRGARRWSAAFVVAVFPLLFIVDRAIETRLSPVLPGLLVLAVLIILLPLAICEAALRITRRRAPERRQRKVEQFQQSGRTALIAALVWVGAWLALGA